MKSALCELSWQVGASVHQHMPAMRLYPTWRQANVSTSALMPCRRRAAQVIALFFLLISIFANFGTAWSGHPHLTFLFFADAAPFPLALPSAIELANGSFANPSHAPALTAALAVVAQGGVRSCPRHRNPLGWCHDYTQR